MRTVGQILREKRLSRGYTLEKVEAATKIRLKFLKAIEVDDYRQLPSPAYAKGFVKNYGEYLGLVSSDLLAFFRRQTTEAGKSGLLPGRGQPSLNPHWFRLTPRRFLLIIGLMLGGVFLSYFGVQYRRLQAPPRLVIETPANGIQVSGKRVEVFGKTDSDATVNINGVSVIVRSDGGFFDQVPIEPGKNKISITATSRYGKTITLVREVVLQTP